MQIIVNSGGESFRSTLAQFIADNEFPSDLVAHIEALLTAGQTYRGGDGAEAAWSVEPDRLAPTRAARQRLVDLLQREFYTAADPLERDAASLAATTLAKLWGLSVSYPPPGLQAAPVNAEAGHAPR